MLTKIEAVSNQGALLTLPLEDLDHGLLLYDVDGLNPVKASINTSSFASLDGSEYQSSRREDRNIKFTISLVPDFSEGETVRDLRHRLYSHFMTKSEVSLRFYDTDGSVARISGWVESFETNLFTSEPSVDISIICPDPDFYSSVPKVTSGYTVSTTAEIPLKYDGTVEVGFKFTLNVNRSLTEFTIYHRDPAGFLRQMDFDGALQAGDSLVINTVPGEKYVRLTRAGVQSSVLYGISQQSSWLQLLPGYNYLRVYATGSGIPFTLEHVEKYGGL